MLLCSGPGDGGTINPGPFTAIYRFLRVSSFLALHLIVGFTVAYLVTGSATMAGGIALIEPLVNAVVFFFHEKAWQQDTPPLELFLHRHGSAT